VRRGGRSEWRSRSRAEQVSGAGALAEGTARAKTGCLTWPTSDKAWEAQAVMEGGGYRLGGDL
jgi:hypothetical protein